MESYEKKYKELEGKIKKAYLYAQTDSTKAVLEDILPELKDNDDRIRKALITYFQRFHYPYGGIESAGTNAKEAIAWLEKQQSVEEIVERCKKSWYNEGKIAGMAEGLTDDEKYQQGWHDALKKQGEKPQGKTAIEAIKEVKVDNANKVEPKFKVGDWVVDKSGFVQQVLIFKEGIYTCTYNSFTTDCASNYHLWTIEDAKDGDVLVSGNIVFIFNKIHNKIHDVWINCHCSTHKDGSFMEEDYDLMTIKYSKEVHPATKEQRDTLMKAMADAGYEWDMDKKELKLLITNGGDFFESKNWEQNSAWNNGYSNGYIQAIEKAVEWLENHNDYIDVKDGNVTYFDMGKCVEDFRKAMKGGEK